MSPQTGTTPTILIDNDVRGSASLTAALLDLSTLETTDGLYGCDATFNNWGTTSGGEGFLYFDRTLLDFGVSVRVTAGPSAFTIFDGRIIALEGRFPPGSSPTIRVRALDRLQDLRMTRRTRTFTDTTDAEVMSLVAALTA